jgi:hypothetical protein
MPTLPSDGRLTAALRPAAALVALRPRVRHRAQLLAPRAPPVLHLQQALLQMHRQVSQGRSDRTRRTGPRLIRALGAGERAPQRLAAWRHSRWQTAPAAIALALTGPWREAPLFVLASALARGDVSTPQLRACEAQIARGFSGMPPRRNPHSHRQHAPEGNARAHSLRMTGGELVAVHGRSDAMAQTIGAEIGTDMRTWPDDKHFCSWLGRAPQHASAGGQGRKSRTRKKPKRAPPAFRKAAPSVTRSHGAFGAFSRRLTGRLGPAQALVATAHKIARPVAHLLTHRGPSHAIGAAEYRQRCRERERQYLPKKAATLGYTRAPVSL